MCIRDRTYSIDSLEVGVRENGIRLVDKIRINVNDESEEAVSNLSLIHILKLQLQLKYYQVYQ